MIRHSDTIIPRASLRIRALARASAAWAICGPVARAVVVVVVVSAGYIVMILGIELLPWRLFFACCLVAGFVAGIMIARRR